MSDGVLVVAPGDQGLNVERDLMAAGSGVALTPLVGTVSRREVLAEIASGRYSIVHMAGHGTHTGFTVSDGEISGHLLKQAIAAGNVGLLVFNFCASVPLAAAVHGQGVAKVISWRDAPGDEQAGRWSQWFYRSYGICGDVWSAFQASVEIFEDRYPGTETPIWLNGRLATMQAQIEQLQQAQAGREHRRRLSWLWLAAVFGLLLVDGILSVPEVRGVLQLPVLLAAPGRALVLFSVVMILWGRLGAGRAV